VADPGGLAATQAFSIAVQVVNTAPGITSTPAAAAAVGARYSYPVQGSDPEGDALAYSMRQAASSAGPPPRPSWAAIASPCWCKTRAASRPRRPTR
jgi:hypothetical protein